MQLTADKTVLMNISFKTDFTEPLRLNDVPISPSTSMAILGIIIDNHLSFSESVDILVRKCNSKLLLIRLQTWGLNAYGLKTFYFYNIRSTLRYALPAWYRFLSGHNCSKVESIQRSASKTIYPDLN